MIPSHTGRSFGIQNRADAQCRYGQEGSERVAQRTAHRAVQASAAGGSRDELAEAATDLFARLGYAGTSMRDIAAAAGCTIGNLYHHHRGKEALLLAILERSVATLPGALRAAEEGGAEGEEAEGEGSEVAPLRRFERLVRAHLSAAERYRRETRIFMAEDEERLPDAARALNHRLQNEVLAIYVAAIDRLADAGLADRDTARICALNVLGVVNWRLRWSRTRRAAATRAAEEEVVTRFILRGVTDRGRQG